MKRALSLVLCLCLAASLFMGLTAVAGAETPAAYSAGNPEDVAAVILHTNDVHVAFQDNIGYDGLALYKKGA